MTDEFPIIEVPLEASESEEAMGTKEKFWFRHQELGLCLYKKARQNTGEDWAEKIAAELCKLLKLPSADYELAICNGEPGVVSPSFVPKGGNLITGNNVLTRTLPSYPREPQNLSQHTINSVLSAIEDASVDLPMNWTPPADIKTAVEAFIGYLLLDAWIGNTDRHHENWAFISVDDKIYLAPTYDHASSLGRNEPDEKRRKRLTTKDSGFSIQAYVEKCTSALYARNSDKKSLTTFDAFCRASQEYPNAAKAWLNNLAKVSSNDTLELFERIPSNLITETAINFAQKILELNQFRLLKLRDTLP